MMKYLIVFSLILSAFGIPSNAARPLQQIDRIYDFGEVGIGFHIFHRFQLANPNSETVKIDSVVVRCDCSYVQVPDSILEPGDTVDIMLDFSTDDYYGKTSKAVRVYTDFAPSPNLEYFYLSTVGQWFLGLKPEPISLFFLPGKTSQKVTIPNDVLEIVRISDVEHYDDRVTATIVSGEAVKGNSLELEVKPGENLGKGTYHTNFRVTLEMSGEFEPLHLTVPVKIVRY